jgi:hypothetical protein
MSNSGLYFSVSGIGTARAADLYRQLQTNLGSKFPEHRFTFLDSPFRGLPHPLTWMISEREKHAVTRLMDCWALLNEHVDKQLRPALARGDIVIAHRFGLDAFLYATALSERGDENNEAALMHQDIVQSRIIRQGIRPPVYLIPKVIDLNLIKSGWVEQSPALRRVSCDDLRAYVEYEWKMLERYFDPNHGQNPPLYIDASSTSKQMCDRAIALIAEAVLINVSAAA